jgi:hypothetical protein
MAIPVVMAHHAVEETMNVILVEKIPEMANVQVDAKVKATSTTTKQMPLVVAATKVHLVGVEVVSAAPPSLIRATTMSSRHLNNMSCPRSSMNRSSSREKHTHMPISLM